MSKKSTNKITIGNTNVQVTKVGLGGGKLSSYDPSPNFTENTIRTAFSLGVRYFDTAPLYVNTQSERNLGRVLPELKRDEFVLSSKAGRIYSEGPLEEIHLSYDAIFKSFESSLKRLGLDRIDILFIHDPNFHRDGREAGFKQVVNETFAAVKELKDSGLVGAIGVGMNEWEMPLRFIQELDLDCVLLAGRYTLMNQIGLKLFLPECEKRNVSVIIGGPFNGGFTSSDIKEDSLYDYKPASSEIIDRARKIKIVCERFNISIKAAALQFPFNHPSVASTIPGARTAEEMSENIELFNTSIPKTFWEELKTEGLIDENTPIDN